jgi:GTP cyclohydrolase I
VTANIHTTAFIWIEEIIELIEKEASCELYGILKRPDEKYVTEKAYDNPKFVEDLVRDIAGHFNADDRIQSYTVSAENFESIHNHSAYAEITHGISDT